MAKIAEAHAKLTDVGVTDRVCTFGLMFLEDLVKQQNGKFDTQYAQRQLRYVLQFNALVFEPSIAWIRFSSHTGKGNSYTYELRVLFESMDAVLGGSFPNGPFIEDALCILNAWMRCCTSRVLAVLCNQPLRRKLVTLIHDPRLSSRWALECVAALMAYCPHMNGGLDEAAPVVAEIISKVSDPLTTQEADPQIIRRSADLVYVLSKCMVPESAAELRSLCMSMGLVSHVVILLQVGQLCLA